MSTINDFLEMMVEKDASDMFFSANTPLHLKINGVMQPVNKKLLSASGILKMANGLMDAEQRETFARTLEMNLGRASSSGKGRFRINIFRQRGDVAIVIRFLKDEIPTIEELRLPAILQNLIQEKRGLILVVGATGSGKSTSLASMIDYRNENTCSHILTLEDPIEYTHKYKKSVVNQREIGMDTTSYEEALKNAMREAPDVILIGEVRERSTMQQAIAYAETGHLCLATLHASNASHVLQRIINFFPDSAHTQLFSDIAHNLRAVVSQRLMRDVNGERIPAVEVMMISPLIKDLIRKGKVHEIREAMEKSSVPGMQTFDQCLLRMYKEGVITEETALEHAESQSNLKLKIRLDKGEGTSDFEKSHGLDAS